MTEAVMVVCPNPKCGREIIEPIVVTILSVTPQKNYKACPHCFTKLEKEDLIEQEIPEPSIEQNQDAEPPIEHEENVTIEQEEQTQENMPTNGVLEKVKDSKLLKRVKALIPNNGTADKKKKKETKEPKIEPEVEEFSQEETEAVNEEELEEIDQEYSTKEETEEEDTPTEDVDSTEEWEDNKEATKEEPKIVESTGKESGQSGCPEEFGYLANRPKDTPIPQGCLTCPKMVDCMLSTRDD